MYRLKQIIKKILIRLHIMKYLEFMRKQEKKQIPDFDMSHREYPVVVWQQGRYLAQLDCKEQPVIALQIHAFFMDVMEEIVDILKAIPYPFDCYISTDTEEKRNAITELLTKNCQIHYLQVDVMDNRGRDVGPFLQQIEPVIDNYKYIAHLHTKKSKHIDFGDDWRHFLFRNLFGGSNIISAILEKFEKDEQLGIVIPEVYPIVRECLAWDSTKEDVQQLLETMGLHAELGDIPICPVGDFFWARCDAVKILFEQGIKQSDFQEEDGQLNYTLAHVIERVWCYMVEAQGYRYEVCVNGMAGTTHNNNNVKRAAIYACGGEITSEDYDSIKKIVENFETTLLVVKTAEEYQEVLEMTGVEAIICNVDTCNQMWHKVCLDKQEIIKEVEELAFIDNSGVGPLFDLKQIMDYMSERELNAWSVFETNLSNTIFSVINLQKVQYMDMLMMIENNVTLPNAYVKESAYIGEWLFAEEPLSELAYDYILLHAPFIKKAGIKHARQNEKGLINKFFEMRNMV